MGKKKSFFEGVATAIVTPFEKGEIDYRSLEKIVEFQLLGGVSAIVVCGTTGEASTLSVTEQRDLIAFTVGKVGGRIPVIAGAGSNDTKRAVRLAENAALSGADAILAVTPYYNKATDEGIVKHYSALTNASGKPTIVYNVPSRSGYSIPVTLYERLAEIKGISGVKEASGSISYSADVIAAVGDRLDVYSGNDDMIAPLMSIGGAGVISVVSNIIPEDTVRLCDLCKEGKREDAATLQINMLGVVRALFSAVNPVPVKYAASLLGLCNNEMRLPLTSADASVADRISTAMKKYGITSK